MAPKRQQAAAEAEPLTDPPSAGIAGPAGSGPAGSGLVFEQVRASFEELGLNGHQAKVLVALLRLGSASPVQLARLANVHRTSAYPVLQELRSRGLAQQVPGGTALWTSPGREEVLDRLRTDHEERLRQVRDRIEHTRTILAEALPASDQAELPYVHIVASAAQARSVYDRLVVEAREELLVLNRAPFSAAASASRAERAAAEESGRDEVNDEVLAALDRGVRFRVLYEAEAWKAASAEPFRRAMSAYHQAGVEGRLTGDLPMKLVICDRTSALFSLADPIMRQVGFPMNLLIEHRGYCEFQADAFDHRWESAKTCPPAERAARGGPGLGGRGGRLGID